RKSTCVRSASSTKAKARNCRRSSAPGRKTEVFRPLRQCLLLSVAKDLCREGIVAHVHDNLAAGDEPVSVDAAVLVLVAADAEDLRPFIRAVGDGQHVAQ